MEKISKVPPLNRYKGGKISVKCLTYEEIVCYIIRQKLKEILHVLYRPKVPCKQLGCAALVEPGNQ